MYRGHLTGCNLQCPGRKSDTRAYIYLDRGRCSRKKSRKTRGAGGRMGRRGVPLFAAELDVDQQMQPQQESMCVLFLHTHVNCSVPFGNGSMVGGAALSKMALCKQLIGLFGSSVASNRLAFLDPYGFSSEQEICRLFMCTFLWLRPPRLRSYCFFLLVFPEAPHTYIRPTLAS